MRLSAASVEMTFSEGVVRNLKAESSRAMGYFSAVAFSSWWNLVGADFETLPIEALAQQSRDMSRSMQLTRVYYDRVETILKKAQRVDVVDRSGAVRTILPGGTP